MLKKIIFSLTLGVIATLYVAQNDQWVHDALARKIKPLLQSAWNCRLEFEVESVNIFVPSITLKNVRCYPKQSNQIQMQNEWGWQANHLTLSTSWISFCLSSMIGLHIDLDTVMAQSTTQGNYIPLVHDHILPMIYGASWDIPLYVKSLSFVTSMVYIKHVASQTMMTMQWSSVSKSINGVFKTNGYLHDGTISIGDKTVLNQMQGDLRLDFTQTVQGLKSDCQINCTAQMPTNSNNHECFISAHWNTDKGAFTIASPSQSLEIKHAQIIKNSQGLSIDALVNLPLSTALSFISDDSQTCVQGDCVVNVHTEYSSESKKIEGQCTVANVKYNGKKICDGVHASFNYSPEQLHGQISLNANGASLEGTWLWDLHAQHGTINLANKTVAQIPGFSKWVIDTNKLQLHGEFDAAHRFKCTHFVIATNQITNSQINCKGAMLWRDGLLSCTGSINRSLYECAIGFNEGPELKKLSYQNSQGLALLDIAQSPGVREFKGTLDIALLRSLSQQFLEYTLQGEGHFGLKGRIKDGKLYLDIDLSDGLIRLPQTYNFINACTAHITCDAAQKNVSIDGVRLGLYRGSISASHITIQADDAYALAYAHAPLEFKSCLLNIKKDFFALFSGTLALTKNPHQLAHAKGAFVIERSYIKENLYAASFQKNITGLTSLMIDADKQDMSCDITLETKEPVRVDTAFLEASAKIALHLTNTIRNPKLSGSIDIISGSLAFPYKPLMITKGSIYFMPDQLFDPLIELMAKNKVKKYNITLQVTGSLLNHHISLESSPPLTDEQIIALLLVGSEEQSLNIVMPALLMQNLKTLLFDSEQSSSRLNTFFKSWLKPFKNINLVPSFSDQTGRGGLRGAIEIEISDRWRAMAQKNFSLSEDTLFEVEYSLSDDITLRGIRNERKDVATEVEMRWKFGR